jgi:hypothetical protein
MISESGDQKSTAWISVACMMVTKNNTLINPVIAETAAGNLKSADKQRYLMHYTPPFCWLQLLACMGIYYILLPQRKYDGASLSQAKLTCDFHPKREEIHRSCRSSSRYPVKCLTHRAAPPMDGCIGHNTEICRICPLYKVLAGPRSFGRLCPKKLTYRLSRASLVAQSL